MPAAQTRAGEVLEALNWRRAIKKFKPDAKLDAQELDYLKEALRLAPSSFGFQAWRFLFVEDPALRKALREKAWGQAQVEDASALVVLCREDELGAESVTRLVRATAERTNAPLKSLEGFESMLSGFVAKLSKEDAAAYMNEQVHIALGFLLFAAAQAGIDACPMGGFEKEGFDEILGLKEKGLRSAVLCALGRRAEDDAYAARPKVRFALDEVVETI